MQPDIEVSSFTPVPALTLEFPPFLTASQTRALAQLASFAELAGHDSSYGGFKPRVLPLLCGPSGAGKTAVVTMLSASLSNPREKFPLLSCNAGSWILTASRCGEHSTLKIIRDFVRQHERGLVFLDELDKSCPTNAWADSYSVSALGELLACMDRDSRLLSAGWTQADVDRFWSFTIVGAGAWAALAANNSGPSSHLTAIRDNPGIPNELFQRFGKLVYVDLPGHRDFLQAFKRVYADLALPLPPGQEMDKLVVAAVESRAGMRHIEEHLTTLLGNHPGRRRRRAPVPAEKTETSSGLCKEPKHVTKQEYDSRREEVIRMMAALEAPLAHIQFVFKINQDAFAKVRRKQPDAKTGEPLSAGDLHRDFSTLIDAMRFWYSTETDERNKRQADLWDLGHTLAVVLWDAINLESEFLEAQGCLPLFTSTYTQLTRFIAAWKYLSTLLTEGVSL